jgi:hypothetical protein
MAGQAIGALLRPVALVAALVGSYFLAQRFN